MLTNFRENNAAFTLGVAALRQTDFPAVPASVSVLDLNYFYLELFQVLEEKEEYSQRHI